jgi:hypothetical protein
MPTGLLVTAVVEQQAGVPVVALVWLSPLTKPLMV